MDALLMLGLFLVLGGIMVTICGRLTPADEARWVVRMLILAMALRFAAATMFALLPETRYFHEDAEGYEGIGMLVAAGWSGAAPPSRIFENLITTNNGFYYISAAIYYLLGRVPVTVSYFNCLVGTFSVFLVYRLARQFFHPVVARRAALLTAVVPSMVLWSSVAIKDALMALLILVSLSSCVRLKRRFSTGALIGVILPLIAVQPIRFYMLYILAFAILASLSFERSSKALTGLTKQLAIGAALIAMLVVFGFVGRAQEGMEFLSLEKVSAFRNGMAVTARSGFAADADVSTPGRAIAFMPFGVAMLLLSPFPWQMTSIRALFAAPEMLVWWSLIPSLIRGLRFAVRRKLSETSPLLIFALTLTLAYSLVHGNVGSGFRQRAQIFVILFIFASLGQYIKRCRERGIDERRLLVDTPAPPPAAVPEPPAAAPSVAQT